jgi:hypothetical protein
LVREVCQQIGVLHLHVVVDVVQPLLCMLLPLLGVSCEQ